MAARRIAVANVATTKDRHRILGRAEYPNMSVLYAVQLAAARAIKTIPDTLSYRLRTAGRDRVLNHAAVGLPLHPHLFR